MDKQLKHDIFMVKLIMASMMIVALLGMVTVFYTLHQTNTETVNTYVNPIANVTANTSSTLSKFDAAFYEVAENRSYVTSHAGLNIPVSLDARMMPVIEENLDFIIKKDISDIEEDNDISVVRSLPVTLESISIIPTDVISRNRALNLPHTAMLETVSFMPVNLVAMSSVNLSGSLLGYATIQDEEVPLLDTTRYEEEISTVFVSETVELDEEDITTDEEVVEEPIVVEEVEVIIEEVAEWEGEVLTKTLGRINGPNGSETYYNLDMSGCVKRMHRLGYEGDYWIRDDGVKMFGNYIMVAADFSTRPLGTILETSLGTAIVVDTGSFVETNPTGIDIAVNW